MKMSRPRPAGMPGALPELPVGNFPTTIKGLDSITIIPQTDHAFSVVFCYPRRPNHDTFTLSRDGKLTGKLPRRLRVGRHQILAEVLRIAVLENGKGNHTRPAPSVGPIATMAGEEAA